MRRGGGGEDSASIYIVHISITPHFLKVLVSWVKSTELTELILTEAKWGKIQINCKMKVKTGFRAKRGSNGTKQQQTLRQENEVAGEFPGRKRYSARHWTSRKRKGEC